MHAPYSHQIKTTPFPHQVKPSWQAFLAGQVSIHGEYVGATGHLTVLYLRVYLEGYKWIQCPVQTIVGNSGKKSLAERCVLQVQY